MTKQTSSSTNNTEMRQNRRAFRSAMSNGLKSAFDPVASRSVPKDFMELLEEADRKRA